MVRRKAKNVSGIRHSTSVSGGVLWRVFNCGQEGCDLMLHVQDKDLKTGGAKFVVSCADDHENHSSLIARASLWKYCSVCAQLLPVERFDRHSRPSSGRQYECRDCKRRINADLNPKRTSDQHREAAERRRIYGLLAGETARKQSEQAVRKRFGHRCFNCNIELGPKEGEIDHTLPIRLLWPQGVHQTLLCTTCNGQKREKWPSDYYTRDGKPDVEKLKKLSYLTGVPFEVLAGPQHLNPKAIDELLESVDEFITRTIKYPDEIRRIRRLVREMADIDIFDYAQHVPEHLK